MPVFLNFTRFQENKISDFPKKLSSWYAVHKRDLPWRKTRDPYVVWLSEIILQQTRVQQGTPYFLRFVEKYPTVFDLANTTEQDVLKTWQGLGYYSRARNLHHTAKTVATKYNGRFPDTYEGLLQLKGIGPYTAAAIASICFDEPRAVVDGNVYRVLSRVFGIDTPINTTKGKKNFQQLAEKLVPESGPGTYNQTVMEFGALHCRQQKPLCGNCIFKNECHAHRHDIVEKLPVKIAKKPIQKRYFNYLVVHGGDGKTLLQQRKSGIWKQLYEFPLIETSGESDLDISRIQGILPVEKITSLSLYNKKPVVHKLTHRHLHIRFWLVETPSLRRAGIPVKELHHFPVPAVLDKFLSDYF